MPKKRKAEEQITKSPAEFFAENQAIAGFDNLGKSLFTTIRELIENGLDACEALNVLPEIRVDIQEFTQVEFNNLQLTDIQIDKKQAFQPESGSCAMETVVDPDLFEKKTTKKRKKIETSGEADANENAETKPQAKEGSAKPSHYFLITVQDNGCGIIHNAIPESFGRVLSGSKYGVRQTRGKFGLGAKMALIWAKKSTGHPIHVRTTNRDSKDDVPTSISSCVLDIDIYKNEPRVIHHSKTKNEEEFIGTTVRVLIAGNWTTYRARILQYLQQLAIITPYAAIRLAYTESTGKRDVQVVYERRSDQMPAVPQTVKHHPSSLNNIIVQQLVRLTKTKTMVSFLSKELSSVSATLAKRLVAELASVKITESSDPSELSDKQITRLVQLFRKVQLFRPPNGACLSPLGEYNLNLGIHKVLEPDLIATHRDKPSSYEGHPFIIETAVSLGGLHAREGITVYRFANRIPLLFEGGADVATRVALTKIRWSNYKIDFRRDKVGVFVSIVSTKIPFKGTSKEYIGDDATEIHKSVKKALQLCCQQLRSHLSKKSALKEAMTRKSRIAKYVPDVGRSLYGLLDGMKRRHVNGLSIADGLTASRDRLVGLVASGELTEEIMKDHLQEAIDNDNLMVNESKKDGEQLAAEAKAAVPVFIVPLFGLEEYTASDVIDDELFTFSPYHSTCKVNVNSQQKAL